MRFSGQGMFFERGTLNIFVFFREHSIENKER